MELWLTSHMRLTQKTVSVCPPTFYKERFIEFIGNVVFKPIDIDKVREFMHHRPASGEVWGVLRQQCARHLHLCL